MQNNDQYTKKDIRVNIQVYANQLKPVAGFGKSAPNPYAVVTLLAGGGSQDLPNVLGKTEV